MQRSATTAFRAFLMLACSVAIPVLAISGASWADIAKKFQNFHCPAILNLASASPATPASASKALPFTPGNLSAKSQLHAGRCSRFATCGRGNGQKSGGSCDELSRNPGPSAKAGGDVLRAGIVGKRPAIVPLLLQDGRGGKRRLCPLLRGHPCRSAAHDAASAATG